MAIINYNQLFDKLQEYIDYKIGVLEDSLRDLFEEYNLKDIYPYLNEIKTVADNLESIQIIGQNMTDIVVCSENIDAIIKAPDEAERIEKYALETEQWYQDTFRSKEDAQRWSSANHGEEIDDGVHTGYSAYHWSVEAQNAVLGIRWRGVWNPNDGAYPNPPDLEHGDFWTVEADGSFDGKNWYLGDRVIWQDDASNTGWVRVPQLISWGAIQNKPSVFPPEDHEHNALYFERGEFIQQSGGSVDSGKPIVLNSEGMVDNSMLKLPVIYLVGSFTPTASQEYPDVIDVRVGATWYISGLQHTGYTFQTGDLAGVNVKNGDYLIYGETEWIAHRQSVLAELYYMRDGSQPMTGHVTVNGWRVTGVADAVDDMDAVNMRQAMTIVGNTFAKSDFIQFSSGIADAGKPILLNAHGLIDPSMVAFNSLKAIGDWNPSGGSEYPDTSSAEPGWYWLVYGVPDSGYTFTGGDLQGREAFNGDYMLYTQSGFVIVHSNIDPDMYYRLDGTNPLAGNMQAAGFLIRGLGEGTDDADATTVRQVQDWLKLKAPATHTHNASDISPQGPGSGLDADMLDGKHASEFAEASHQHAVGDIIPQGDGSGLDADKLDGRHADEFKEATWLPDWSEIQNKPATFTPPAASESTLGGARMWMQDGTLYIETTNP